MTKKGDFVVYTLGQWVWSMLVMDPDLLCNVTRLCTDKDTDKVQILSHAERA